MAFERLDHAYLVHDDVAVRRELDLISRLRDEAAAAAAGGAAQRQESVLADIIARLGFVVEQLLSVELVPALVRGPTTEKATRQADAVFGDEERGALGDDVEASAVYNGERLGVDLVGVDRRVEDRIHLFVDESGELTELPVVVSEEGLGLLSATLPWASGLPEQLIVVVEAVE